MRNLCILLLNLCIFGAIYLFPSHVEARRLYTNGFEWQSTATGVEASVAVTGAPAINTTIKHSGAASFRANVSAATALQRHQFRTDAVADAYMRSYVYITTLPGANVTILSYCDSANFCGAKLKLQSDGGLQCDNSDGSLTTNGTATLSTATWYRLELFYDETNNQCTVKVDGTTDISAATVDDVGGGGRVSWGALDSATTDIYWDDIAVNDTATTLPGAVTGQTSYPGAGNIVILVPNAAGSSNCTTGDYSMISEIPPSDTATSGSTMCELDTDGGMTAKFNMTDTATAGVDSYDTPTLIWFWERSRDDSAGAGANTYSFTFTSGSVSLTSGTADPSNATVRTNPSGTTAFGLLYATTTDPSTGAAWTTTALDSMQAGITTTDGAPDVWILTYAIMLEYTDGTPPAGGAPSGGMPIIWFN